MKQSGMKIGTLTIILLMLLGSSFFLMDTEQAAAASEGDFIYHIDGNPGYAIITDYTGSGGDVVIPETLGGYATAAIGDGAFQSLASISSVTLPESLLSIGAGAFGYCSGLTFISIPNGVEHIGAGAFQYCISLTYVVLGDHIPIISQDSFYYCTSLSSIIIPDSVTSVADGAFSHCTSMTSAIMGSGVTSIGNGAFASCTSMTSVVLGAVLKNIGNDAFSHCTSLTSLTMPDSLSSIGDGAFSYCISLAAVNYGRSLSEMGDGAFSHCTSLTSMTFLGIVAPTVGTEWIFGTSLGLRGHALSASNFPIPGNSFFGLTMGVAIPSEPAAPRSLVATPGNRMVTLNWTVPAYDGGSNITEYSVHRSFSIGSNYTLIGSPTGLIFIDADLQNGVTCWYKVAAINANGIGPEAGPASATPGTPTSPRFFNATGSVGVVTLSWLRPADESGSDIIGYDIYRILNGVPIKLATVAAYALDYADSSGEIGVTYGYVVQAINGNGPGAITAEVFMASQTPSDANIYFLLIILIVIVVAVVVIFVVLRMKKRAQKERDASVVDQFDPTNIYQKTNNGPKNDKKRP